MGFEFCHPAVNFIFFAAALYGSIAFSHPVFLAIAYAAAFAYSVRRGGRRALVFDLCLLPLVLFFALCYAGNHHFGMTVLRQNFIGNNMTAESLVYGLVLGVRAACVCMWCSCLFRVVSSDKVVYLFGRVSPRLALFLTILLRLIPRLNREAGRIDLAQKGIGRGSDQGNLWERLVHCLRIFSILITWLIQALALEADSMKSRGSALRGRTAFSIYRFDNRDRAFVIALFSGIILTGMGAILGATEMFYDPVILWKPLNGLAAVSAVGYAFLCLLPLGLELWTECRFERLRRMRDLRRFAHPAQERRLRYAQPLRRGTRTHLAAIPAAVYLRECGRNFQPRAAERLPARPCGGNALGLPLADEDTLRFCHIAEKLQNDIRRQRSGEIALLPRIEQRHIQHHDTHAPLVCENSPLLQNFAVVPP